MFKVFDFKIMGNFSVDCLKQAGNIFGAFMSNIDINEMLRQYNELLQQYNEGNSNASDNEENLEEIEDSFIRLEQYEDMYLLKINLKGIDLREVSIRYDLGVIDINLKRLEIEKRGFGLFSSDVYVKKRYNKTFEGIEDIDVSCVMRSIDNGIFSIRMPKKFFINSSSKIIDVDNYKIEG